MPHDRLPCPRCLSLRPSARDSKAPVQCEEELGGQRGDVCQWIPHGWRVGRPCQSHLLMPCCDARHSCTIHYMLGAVVEAGLSLLGMTLKSTAAASRMAVPWSCTSMCPQPYS